MFNNFLNINYPFSNTFYFLELIQCIVFISYFLGLTLLLSTIISNPSITMFLGITLSIILPVIGMISIGSNNIIIKMISYITPYYYFTQEQTAFTYIVILFPILFIIVSLMLLERGIYSVCTQNDQSNKEIWK